VSRLPFHLRFREPAVIRLPRREIDRAGTKRTLKNRRDTAGVWMSIDLLAGTDNHQATVHVGDLVQFIGTNNPRRVGLSGRFIASDNDAR
jgi:hypothetical protein